MTDAAKETLRRVRASLATVVIAPVRYVFVPVRSVVISLLGVFDLVVDEIYWRFDLWSVPPTETARGVADYSKVRGFCAFWIAVGLDIWFFMRTASMPVVIALLTPLGLLAYSFGERVFIAFIKSLPSIVSGWRGKALGQSVDVGAVAAAPGKADDTDG